jgi:CRP-like cAMP-binding protein
MVDYNQALHKIWAHFNQITPFSRDEFDKMANLTILKVLKKGEIVYKQGSIPEYGGYIIRGALREFYTPPFERRDVTTGFHFEDTCFGDLRSIFYNEPALTSLQAIETTYIGQLDKLHYLHLFDTCKPFARVMMLSMESKYNELLNETIERIDREAEQRYLKMLNQYPQILQRVSQRYIASYLGIKPQSLSRIRKNITERKSSRAA